MRRRALTGNAIVSSSSYSHQCLVVWTCFGEPGSRGTQSRVGAGRRHGGPLCIQGCVRNFHAIGEHNVSKGCKIAVELPVAAVLKISIVLLNSVRQTLYTSVSRSVYFCSSLGRLLSLRSSRRCQFILIKQNNRKWCMMSVLCMWETENSCTVWSVRADVQGDMQCLRDSGGPRS